MQTYLVVVRQYGFYLVGPFADTPEAALWALHHNPEQSTEWWPTKLDTVPVGVTVYTPETGTIGE